MKTKIIIMMVIFSLSLIPSAMAYCVTGTTRCATTAEKATYGDEVISCNSKTNEWCPAGVSSIYCPLLGCDCETVGVGQAVCKGGQTNCNQCSGGKSPNSRYCMGDVAVQCEFNYMTSCWMDGFDTNHRTFCDYGCSNGVCSPAPKSTCQSDCSGTSQYICTSDPQSHTPNTFMVQCTLGSDGCYHFDPTKGNSKTCLYGCANYGNGVADCYSTPQKCPTDCVLGQTSSDGTYIYTCINDNSSVSCNKWCTNPSDCINWYTDSTSGQNGSGIIKCDFGTFYNSKDNKYYCDSYFSTTYNISIKGFAWTLPISFTTNLNSLFPNDTNVGTTEVWAAAGFMYWENATFAATLPTISMGEIKNGVLTSNNFVYVLPHYWDLNASYGLFYDNTNLWLKMGDARWHSFNPYNMNYNYKSFTTTVPMASGSNPVWLDNKIYFTGSAYYTSNYTYVMDYDSSTGTYTSDTKYTIGNGSVGIAQLIYDGTNWWGIGTPCLNDIHRSCPQLADYMYEFGANWSIINTVPMSSFSKGQVFPTSTTIDKSLFIGGNFSTTTSSYNILGETLLNVFLLQKNGQLVSNVCPPSRTGTNGLQYATRCGGSNYVDSNGTAYTDSYKEIQVCEQDPSTGNWGWNADPNFYYTQNNGVTAPASCLFACQLDTSSPNSAFASFADQRWLPKACGTRPPNFTCSPDCDYQGQISCSNGWYKVCQPKFYVDTLNHLNFCLKYSQNSTRCASGSCGTSHSCAINNECRKGDTFCGSLGEHKDVISVCYFDTSVGAWLKCPTDKSSTNCPLTQCSWDEACFQNFDQATTLTTATCTPISYNDWLNLSNYLSEMGVNFNPNSQIGILTGMNTDNKFGGAALFIVLSIIGTLIGIYVSSNLYGGITIGALILMMGVFIGWLPAILLVLIIVALAIGLGKIFFGGSSND